MKAYFIATNSAYNVITMANSETEAIKKADLYYYREYGESRDDWSAYELNGFLKQYNDSGVMAVQTWDAWEYYLKSNKIGGWG